MTREKWKNVWSEFRQIEKAQRYGIIICNPNQMFGGLSEKGRKNAGRQGGKMELKKQNILFLTRTMKPGGTENVILQLCEIFKPLVHKVLVCSCGGENVKKLEDLGIEHRLMPDMSNKSPYAVLQNCRTVKKILREEQITVVHSHHRMAAFYAELVAPENICKLANVHNTFYDKRMLTEIAYRRTGLIAVGEMVKKNLTDHFHISGERITVIRNTVKAFGSTAHPVQELCELKEQGCVLIGNVGRLSEQKGMSYFIEAAAEVYKDYPMSRFIIVGDGEEKVHLKQLVEEKKLEGVVVFLGYREDIQNIMQQLDFVVLSSLWEGFPLTPIEAFSVKKTVIATAVDGTKEIVKDDVNGYLVRPRDIAALAEKMKYLISHPETREALEENAKMCYDADFSFDQLRKAYIRYYEGLS